MGEIIRLAGVLTLITGIAATALSNVYMLARDRIAQVESAREEEARRTALPQATVFSADTTADGFVFYRGWADSTAGGEPVGYITLALGKGYSSRVRTMVGVDREMIITGIKIAFQQETPGLGTRIEEVRRGDKTPWFQEQFRGKTREYLEVVRTADPERIEAITGATISSEAVTSSVRKAVEQLEQVIR